jgi:hypothetical protein
MEGVPPPAHPSIGVMCLLLIFVLLEAPANDLTGAPDSCEHAQCRR